MSKEAEFIRIIKEHEGVIYKITSFYTNNAEDQKDLYQEIVFQLWKSFDSFRKEAKISTWMYRVALNTAITQLNRQKKNQNQTPIDKAMLDVIDYHDTIFEERVKALYAHIKQLNEIEKALILLFLEGKTYEEMAGITGFTTTNVGTRLGRIKQKLKSQMTPDARFTRSGLSGK